MASWVSVQVVVVGAASLALASAAVAGGGDAGAGLVAGVAAAAAAAGGGGGGGGGCGGCGATCPCAGGRVAATEGFLTSIVWIVMLSVNEHSGFCGNGDMHGVGRERRVGDYGTEAIPHFVLLRLQTCLKKTNWVREFKEESVRFKCVGGAMRKSKLLVGRGCN